MNWSSAEVALLIKLVQKHGSNHVYIAKCMPNKTDDQIISAMAKMGVFNKILH